MFAGTSPIAVCARGGSVVAIPSNTITDEAGVAITDEAGVIITTG